MKFIKLLLSILLSITILGVSNNSVFGRDTTYCDHTLTIVGDSNDPNNIHV